MSVIVQVYFRPEWRPSQNRPFEVVRLPFATDAAAIDAATSGHAMVSGTIVHSKRTEEANVREIVKETPIAFRACAVDRAQSTIWSFRP